MGDSAAVPSDGPPSMDAAQSGDAARPADARAIDAADGPAPIDADHDGHPASEDCDDADPAVWQSLAYTWLVE